MPAYLKFEIINIKMIKKLLLTFAFIAISLCQIAAQGYWSARPLKSVSARSFPSSFVIGSHAYLGTGLRTPSAVSGASKDFWKFDPLNGTWSQIADFGGISRWAAFAFATNGNGYVGCGRDSAGTNYSDFYCYDPSTNSWTKKADFSGGARRGAIGMECDGKEPSGPNFRQQPLWPPESHVRIGNSLATSIVGGFVSAI